MTSGFTDVLRCTSESHDRLKRDPAWWTAQRFIGRQVTDEEYDLELRNCVLCDSTLACRCPKQQEEVG